jgi:hypothetical protein
MTLLKPVVVNGVTKANAELFNEYGDDLETIANTMLGTGAITESQLATAVSKRLVPTGGSTGQYLKWKENGTAEWSTGAGLSKAEAETLAQEAVKKAELPGAIAVATVNVTLSGIPAQSQTDEVTVVEGNIILAPFQTNEKERGLWEVKSGAWVRPTGFETGRELPLGVTIAVAAGKEYKGSIWDFENKTRVIVGTTAQVWNDNSAGGSIGLGELESKLYYHLTAPKLGSNLGIGGYGSETTPLYAMETFFSLSKVEQEKHHGTVAVGPEALARLSGLVETGQPRANTAIGSKKFHLPSGAVTTEVQPYWVTNNVPNLTFAKITAGVTGIETGLPYWIVGRSGTEFELIQAGGYPVTQAEIESKHTKGEGIVTIAGHALEAATTEFILSASCEDNVAIGAEAMAQTIRGGGNIAVGQRALWTCQGEENIGIGIEALHESQSSNNLAIGFQALTSQTTGGSNMALGYKVLSGLTTGNDNITIGFLAGNSHNGSQNIAIGREVMGTSAGGSTPEGNIIIGNQAGTNPGNINTFIGWNGGESCTGEANVFIGAFAGHYKKAVSNQFILSSVYYSTEAEETAHPGLITGEFPNAKLALNAAKLGFNGKAPVTLVAESLATGTLTATNVTPYGFATEAQALAVVKFCEKFSKWAHESGLTA